MLRHREDRVFWADDSAWANGAQHAHRELAYDWEPRPVVAAPALPDGLVDRRKAAAEAVASRRWWPAVTLLQPET